MSIDVRQDKRWLTAAEAAAEKLPGLPGSKSQINRVLTEASIQTRKRNARGGGREFHWENLPAEARAEYLKRYASSEAPAADAKPLAREAIRHHIADARAEIVDAAYALIADRAMPICKGLRVFSAAYEQRKAKVEPRVYQLVPCVEPHQLRTWYRVLRHEGTAGLIDKRGRPKGTGLFETDLELKNFAIAQFAARPQLSATQFRDIIALPQPHGLGREIALRTLQAFLAPLRKSAPAKALIDPDRYRSHHKPAFGSLSQNVTRINQKWMIDASPADAMCLVDGRPMRMKLTAVIDVLTRRAMVLVSDQARAEATKALLRRAILAWGVPELVKADNGKEFKNLSVERFCRDTGIALDWSTKFTPEEKGNIERFFGTLQRGLFELLPGYVGHSVAERKGIENRKSFAHRFGETAEITFDVELAPEGLQARIDGWLRNIYEQRQHEGLGHRPCDKALAHAAEARAIGDERALDALMMIAPDAHGIRNVRKKGIAIGGRFYIAPELGSIMGERVHCRMDAFDLSRIAVFTADASRFISVSEHPAFIPPDRIIHIAREAQANDRSRVRAIRDGARKVLQLHPTSGIADRLIEHAGGEGFFLADDARAAMQHAASPRLISARAVADAMDASRAEPQPIPVSESAREASDQVIAELEARNAVPAQRVVPCDGYERPAFADDDVGLYRFLRARLADGLPIDATDRTLFTELQRSPAFAAMLANDEARSALVSA